MPVASVIHTTTGSDFNGGQSITLSGEDDVLVFLAFGDTASGSAVGIRITKDGTSYDFTLGADGTTSYRSCAAYYYLDAASLGSGAATLTRVGPAWCGGFGGTLYGLRGVQVSAPEATATASGVVSTSITTVSNGAHVLAAICSDSVSVTGIGGVLDNYIPGTYSRGGAASEGVAGSIGAQTVSCTLSAGTYGRFAVLAFTAADQVVPADVGVTFDGLQAGSEVRLYERAHPQQWTIDLTNATPATCDGKVLHYEVQGASAVTVHEVWIDLDDGSATPYGATAWAGETGYTAADHVTNGGRLYVCTTTGTSAASGGPTGTGTGIEDGTCEWDYVTDFAWCDVATGNTAAQIAAAIEAVIDDDADVTSSVANTVISVADNRDGGPLAIPTATFPATVTVVQEGNTASAGEEIDGVEDSTGTSWEASVTVANPRLVDVVIVNPGWEPIRIESYLVTRADATVPIAQRFDLNYYNP